MIQIQSTAPISVTIGEFYPTTGDKYSDAALAIIADFGAMMQGYVAMGRTLPFHHMAVLSNLYIEDGLGWSKVDPRVNEAVKNMQKLGWFIDTGKQDTLTYSPANKVWHIATDFDLIRSCLALYLDVTPFNVASLVNAHGLVLLQHKADVVNDVSDFGIKAGTAFLAGLGLIQHVQLHAHYPTKPKESFTNPVSFIGDLVQINAMSELWGLLYPDELVNVSVQK